ncbi:MAG TPA: hypothetical protein PK095_05100, partial [Myxococcota bacterium]|nr:hypothetical protein [Myxococcota bacterium]
MSRPRLMRVSALLVLSFVMTLGACVTRSALVIKEQLTDKDLRLGYADPKNRDSGDFAEQVVVRGVLSDGGSFYAKLTVANIANADGRADFTFDAKLGDGRRANCKSKKQKGDWEAARDRLKVTVGDGDLEVSVGRAVVSADCDGFKAVVTIETELPPLRPTGGLFDQGGAFYMTTLPIPRGRLSATIEPNEPLPRIAPKPEEAPPSDDGEGGEDTTSPEAEPSEEPPVDELGGEVEAEALDVDEELEPIEVEGIGYVEHRAGNLPPYLLAHAWFNVLEITEDTTLIMSSFERKRTADTPMKERGRGRGWLLVVNDDGLVLYEPEVDLWVRGTRSDEVTGYSLPELVFVADPRRAVFKGVIKPGTLSLRKDDLSNLKKLERLVVRRFMKPWTFTYNHAEYVEQRRVMMQD